MKRKFIIILCFILLFSSFLCGCKSEEDKLKDKQMDEIFDLVDKGNVLQAKEKAQEYYGDDKIELKAMIETIDYVAEAKERKDDSYQRNDKSTSTLANTLEDKLVIQDHRDITIEDGYIYIDGSVKNVTNKVISYYKITVKYLDENYNVIHSNYTNSIENLYPDESREFEIMNKYNDYKYTELVVDEVNFK